MKHTLLVASVISTMTMTLSAELPASIQAKFVRIIAGTSIACKHQALVSDLSAIGVAVDPASKFGFATTESEVNTMKGKLIIVTSLPLLAKGGSIAIVEEGGKPQIYLHMGNLNASGVVPPDAILKIGKKL